MIKLGTIQIEEFRGVRELELDFKYESFAIHGPNGSGKSGVVDAIGFALTGSIARLTGSGTGSVSVKKHAPHVKTITDPDAARVSLTFKDVASGQIGTITRTVKEPNDYTLTPNTPELQQALDSALAHPEITLSRRELIRFIIAEASTRSQEVQALLQLGQIDSNRKALKSAANKVDAEKKAASIAVSSSKFQVETHLDIEDLNEEKVRLAINPTRKILGLAEFKEVKLSTNLKEGLDDDKNEKPFDKESSKKDIKSYDDFVVDDFAATATTELSDQLAKVASGTDFEQLKNRTFLEAGLSLIEDESNCPLCDTQWKTPEDLKKHLAEKIASSKEVDQINTAIKSKAEALKDVLAEERGFLKPVQTLAASWSDALDQETILKRVNLLVEIETLLKETQTAIGLKERLEAGVLDRSEEFEAAINRLRDKVAGQPDTSEKSKASNHLILAAERWNNFASAKANEATAMVASKRGSLVYDTYCKIADTHLEELYASVEDRFSTFYGIINKDDEGTFKAEFKPEGAKLDLLVDFYGLGMFPPGAYHSEGHQDGMGICLYLALIEKIMGDNFSLSVLDDVVMSVDVNHRREFCELLKNEFPDTQFILTTHDEIWAKQMQTTGLIQTKADVRFRGWSVEDGPIYEQGKVFWDKIEEYLEADDVHLAAATLRRGLEAELPDIAEAIGAHVAFRGDAKYELGDFQHSVKGRHSKILKAAKASAISWGNVAEQEKINNLDEVRAAAAFAQDKENWAINLQVHYNDWATMPAAEFRHVVTAWREFLDLFTCANEACETWIYVVGSNGREESIRCRCGGYNLNLLKKPAN